MACIASSWSRMRGRGRGCKESTIGGRRARHRHRNNISSGQHTWLNLILSVPTSRAVGKVNGDVGGGCEDHICKVSWR